MRFGVTDHECTVVFLVPALIIGLIGEIMQLVGLWQGGKDEPTCLKKAFWVAIVMVVISAVSGSMTGANGEQTQVTNVLQIINELLSLIVINFVIEGVGRLCAQAGHSAVLDFGHRLMMWLTAALVCSIIATIASNWVGQTAAVIGLVLIIVVYIGYLVFLSRAKKALA